ncbi:MAG: hypothetical protein ACTSU5_07430 [Promethearchaeota archaeon]
MVSITMHIEGSVVPDGPIEDFSDCWEEFEDFAEQMLNMNTRSYIGLQVTDEGGFEKFLNFVPLSESTWGVTVGDSERTMGTGELKDLLGAIFSGKIPDWVRDAPDIDKGTTGLSRW